MSKSILRTYHVLNINMKPVIQHRTINHIQYNNGNGNLKIHINFTYSKQFKKVQVTFDIKETYLSKHT